MPFSLGDRLGSCALLRIVVVLGLLAGFALSPKLWLSSRLYPLTPVWSFIQPFASPGDAIVFFALIVLLIGVAAAPRRGLLAAAFALILLLTLQDQSRWQPWFYQYALMLLAIVLAGSSRQDAAMNTCRLIVAATYLWSGLAKLNPQFMSDTLPWLLHPLLKSWPAPAQRFVLHLAFLAPLVEFATGAGLFTRRFRRAALMLAIAMHGFILIVIGPLGSNFNTVVWPWNLAMIAFLLILYFRPARQPALRDIVWGRGFAFQRIVLVLFAIMPIFSLFNLWDDYLSVALYSGNINSGVMYMDDDAFDRLPPAVAAFVTDEGKNLDGLDINDWSYGELNVPAYPESRIFRNVARQVCSYTEDSASLKLVVRGKFALGHRGRQSVYRCAGLQRGF